MDVLETPVVPVIGGQQPRQCQSMPAPPHHHRPHINLPILQAFGGGEGVAPGNRHIGTSASEQHHLIVGARCAACAFWFAGGGTGLRRAAGFGIRARPPACRAAAERTRTTTSTGRGLWGVQR